jgi:hypothetical protein
MRRRYNCITSARRAVLRDRAIASLMTIRVSQVASLASPRN